MSIGLWNRNSFEGCPLERSAEQDLAVAAISYSNYFLIGRVFSYFYLCIFSKT